MFGSYSRQEILFEVAHQEWQAARRSMLGAPLKFKWSMLRGYLVSNQCSRHAQVVVTNYVYALKRGGLIK